MKRLIYLSILIILLTGCSPYKNMGIPIPCNENLDFKRDFFYHIWVVEKYTIEHERFIDYKNVVSMEQFLQSYNYLFKSTGIYPGDITNYQTTYESYKAFKTDKKKWLKWYEVHKCSHLVKQDRVSK